MVMDKLIIGCGYLGRRVAACWLAQGHRVYATTRTEHRAAELCNLGVEPVLCQVLDPDNLTALPISDTVVHCVAPDRTTGHTMRDLYVGGLNNVLARLPTPRHFLYISSTSVYGQTGGVYVDESSPTEPLEESGQIVLEAEEVLRYWLPKATVLRFAAIYGPGRLLRSKAIQAGEPIVADPDKWLNLIQVYDGAAAVLAAEARAQPGAVYNVCDGYPVRRCDFYTTMARLLNAPPPRFLPPSPGDPLPPHESANRRINSRRMREELGVSLRFPSYVAGLEAAVKLAP
jgi:nucleoside-diphosphate-sugar epimerase